MIYVSFRECILDDIKQHETALILRVMIEGKSVVVQVLGCPKNSAHDL